MGLVGWYNYSVGLVRTDPSKDLSFNRYKVYILDWWSAYC